MTDRLPNVAVLGCGRSGTSIVCELFDALPGYRGLSEPLLADVEIATGGGVAVKVPRTTPGTFPPHGCSVSIDELTSTLGNDVIIFWQVRHPLDTICSLRPGIADDWGHHPRPPDHAAWAARPLVERCAHHWATINTHGFDHVRDRAAVLRFEHLIADPTGFVASVTATIGIEADPTGPPLARWIDRVQDTDNERFVEAVTSRRRSRPDHVRRVGRWRENLTADDVAAVVPIVASAAATFGYAVA